MRAAALVAGAVVALVVTASPAGAAHILAQEDAVELAALLAEASEQQDGICYGWEVDVADENGRFTGSDVGSNLGVGKSARTCPRYLVFGARINYTSETSERSDTATLSLPTSFSPGTFTDADLARVGVTSGSLLSNDRDDVAIVNATLALPLLVAERGFAAPVRAEPDAQPVASGDAVQGSHGSDWLRKYGGVMLAGGLFVLVGVAWLVFARFQEAIVGAASQLTKED